jgi:hypothetical protein
MQSCINDSRSGGIYCACGMPAVTVEGNINGDSQTRDGVDEYMGFSSVLAVASRARD